MLICSIYTCFYGQKMPVGPYLSNIWPVVTKLQTRISPGLRWIFWSSWVQMKENTEYFDANWWFLGFQLVLGGYKGGILTPQGPIIGGKPKKKKVKLQKCISLVFEGILTSNKFCWVPQYALLTPPWGTPPWGTPPGRFWEGPGAPPRASGRLPVFKGVKEKAYLWLFRRSLAPPWAKWP